MVVAWSDSVLRQTNAWYKVHGSPKLSARRITLIGLREWYSYEIFRRMFQFHYLIFPKNALFCGDSQSACSISNISKPNNTNKKRNGAEKESVEKPKTGNQRNCKKTKLKKRNGAEKESVEKTKTGNQRNCKKTKLVENSNVTTHAKVKKEKLGERITALHNNLYLPLARQTQHQCYMKRWDISGFCTIRFTSCVLLTCSASARASLPPYVRAEKVGKGKHRE